MSDSSRYKCLNHFVDMVVKFFTNCVDVCIANSLERVLFNKFILSIVFRASETPERLEYGFRFSYWTFDQKMGRIVFSEVICRGEGLILFGKKKTIATEATLRVLFEQVGKSMACLNRASSKISMVSFSSPLEVLAVFHFGSGKFRSLQIMAGFDFGRVLRSFLKRLILYRYANEQIITSDLAS